MKIIEFLTAIPSPEEILALQPSDAFQARVQALLEKNREEGLTPAEEQEWQQYQYLEHLVRMAKARALLEKRLFKSG
jgi:hypothetical protein